MKKECSCKALIVLVACLLASFPRSGAMAADFFAQPCAADTAFVSSLYRSILQREQDADGFRYWVNSMRSGMQREEVIRRFFSSPEYQGFRRTNRDYATDLYFGVLGREPDRDGHIHWKASLDSGMSRSEVLEGFFRSSEYQQIRGRCR